MGRNPLDPDDVTVKTTLRLPLKLLARMEAFTGDNQMSGWVRKAVEARLNAEGAPPFDPSMLPLPSAERRQKKGKPRPD